MKRVWHDREVAPFGLLLGLAILFLLVGFAYRQLLDQRDRVVWVIHTHKVIESIERALLRITDAERGQRGYLLSGNERDLITYDAAIDAMDEEMRRLRTLTMDNPDQLARLAGLETATRKKLAELQKSIDLRKKRRRAVLPFVQTHRGQEIMTEIQMIVQAMVQEEYDLLRARSDQQETDGRRARFMILLGSVLSSALVVTAVWLIRRHRIVRTLAEAKVRKSLKLKSDFISIVSHELRTPMTAIKEGIEIILDGSAGRLNAEQQDYLKTVKRNVDRLNRLVHDALDFQRLESGRMEFRKRREDISLLIRDVIDEFGPLARKKGLHLTSDVAAELPEVPCDRDRVTQVLYNLLSNAVSCTSQGRVSVRATHDGNSIRVLTEDQGCGIRREDLSKLFESFAQLSIEGGRPTGRSGLGLAICKRIIKEHGGSIGVESTFGVGSTFYFTLPLEAPRG